MIRRIPIVPTLLVLAAVAVMVRLGFWQLDRLGQKEALLAKYAAVQGSTVLVPWPSAGAERSALEYRRTTVDCIKVIGIREQAGQNAGGEPGWAHIAQCETGQGYNRAEIVLGWSNSPQVPVWNGGRASGTFLMRGQYATRVVADPPLAGLEANAKPDPANIPNNHLAYAVQWFLFALTALVIYALALRKRLAATD
jgi:surfeit locus 1 family protein